MKFKKKTAIILSFALGTTMFATTAFAEVVSKSGYDQLKDSVKYTAESCTTKLSSYTMDMSFVLKDNGNVIASETTLGKYDVSKQAVETKSSSTEGPNKRDSYYYTDKNSRINKSNEQNIYYVTEFTTPQENHSFKNPFNEKQAGDAEKIADALVGNLKDSVIVNQNPDGSKELSGSLTEAQIPALINAIVSFQSKNEFGNRQNSESYMPKIAKDIFVKEIKGKMIVDKNGLIQSVLGTGVVSGKDESGKEHTITFELLGKITNVNSTVVKKPDLTGQKVEKTIEKDYNKLSNPEKYKGKYKTDILIEKDGKFQKIGEKFVDVTNVTESNISGRYYEEYLKGFEDYGTNKKDFKFDAKFSQNHFDAQFTADNNVKGNIYIDQHSGKINFNVDGTMNGNMLFDSQFSRVFN